MDMQTSTSMAMDMGSATAAAAAASATSTMTMSMGGDSMCKISMLWNWYTVDACFIAQSWRITSSGMFAGSCIGVILLVMSLEFLRCASREYDNYIFQKAGRRQQHYEAGPISTARDSTAMKNDAHTVALIACSTNSSVRSFRPSVFQQLIRAALHMLQFAVAYFIMLLAMYYNGYIIICIIIGAFIGAFVFSWETITLGDSKQEATFCCG